MISLCLGFVSGLIRSMTCCVKCGSYLLLLSWTALVPFVAMMMFFFGVYIRTLVSSVSGFIGTASFLKKSENEESLTDNV